MLIKTVRLLGLVIVAVIVLLGAWAFVSTPISRARAYARVAIGWQSRWPLARGAYLPYRLAPLLTATGLVRSVRLEVEPRVSFLLDPFDVIDTEVLATGVHDDDVFQWVASHLPRGGTLIDVGAHIGTFTVRGAKVVGDQGRVVAVEPNPATVARLRDNVAASGWHNVDVEPVACADTAGTMKLYLGNRINSGSASLSKQGASHHDAKGDFVEVQVATLDQIVARTGLLRIDAIKIDVEGAEVMVLRGARNSIAKYRPIIVTEAIDSQLRDMGTSLADLEAILTAYGYAKARTDSSNSEWIPRNR